MSGRWLTPSIHMEEEDKIGPATSFENGGQRTDRRDTDSFPGEPIGVVLLNLGGPDSLSAVRPFLYNLFSDRQIIPLGPAFMQKPIAMLISAIRSRRTEKMYRLIGGRSPISEITEAQAKALEEALNGHTRPSVFKVYIAMRYWHPLIEDVVSEIHGSGIKKLVALSLYPQYSAATSGSSFSRFNEAVSPYEMETFPVSSWYDHPLYIDALVDVIKEGLDSFPNSTPGSGSSKDVHVLFSAHGLPESIIEQGDPYVDQIAGTIKEITKQMPLQWHLSYQSRSGPVKWLGPSTDAKLEELSGGGVKNVLVVPISFVSDHIETLYEIDILYKTLAEKLGMSLRRTSSLNTHPKFIEALKDLVESALNRTQQNKSRALP
jgi:ferrochelatase